MVLAARQVPADHAKITRAEHRRALAVMETS